MICYLCWNRSFFFSCEVSVLICQFILYPWVLWIRLKTIQYDFFFPLFFMCVFSLFGFGFPKMIQFFWQVCKNGGFVVLRLERGLWDEPFKALRKGLDLYCHTCISISNALKIKLCYDAYLFFNLLFWSFFPRELGRSSFLLVLMQWSRNMVCEMVYCLQRLYLTNAVRDFL